MLLFQECISSRQNETQMFVEGLKCCKFFNNYILPYTGMLESLFCKGHQQNLTSDDLPISKCLTFDLPKSFNESQAKEWFEEYVKGTAKLSQLLAFCASYRIMPFNDLSEAINVKYLQNSNISMFKNIVFTSYLF